MGLREFFILLLLFGFTSCYYDNEEDLYPKVQVVSYSIHIAPIISNSCATQGCHVPNGSGTGILQTYEEVKAIADNGKLKTKVLDLKDMPKAGPLPLNERDLIASWINNGALNN